MIALGSSGWGLLDLFGKISRTPETLGVDGFENRFSGLKKVVTPRAVFGYVSDTAVDDPTFQAEFYLTQYTLSPAIVLSTSDMPLVVANMHSGSVDMNALQARHLVPVQNFGNGVLLCRNTSISR